MFTRDGLNHLWNEMMKDGELVLTTGKTHSSDELPNSSGAIARRGDYVCMCIVLYCTIRGDHRSRGRYHSLRSVLRPDQFDPVHSPLNLCKVEFCISDVLHYSDSAYESVGRALG